VFSLVLEDVGKGGGPPKCREPLFAIILSYRTDQDRRRFDIAASQLLLSGRSLLSAASRSSKDWTARQSCCYHSWSLHNVTANLHRGLPCPYQFMALGGGCSVTQSEVPDGECEKGAANYCKPPISLLRAKLLARIAISDCSGPFSDCSAVSFL
jgi:hypothetical protein